MVLDALDQRVDGLEAEAVVPAAVEAVRFVNEQHAAQRALDDLVGQRRGVADIAPDQVGAGHFDKLAAAQRADGFEVFGQNAPRYLRVAGKDHVAV